MYAIRLHRFIALLIAVVLTLMGFLVSVRAAVAVGETDLVLRLDYVDHPDAGTSTEYAAVIGNISAEPLRDLPVTLTLGQGMWRASFVDEKQPCELYRLVAGGEPILVRTENCFSGAGAILRDGGFSGGGSSPSVSGTLNPLPPQHHYRIKLRAHLPYNESETRHTLSVGSSAGPVSEVTRSFRQFVAKSELGTSSVQVKVARPFSTAALQVGNPGDEGGNSADYAEYSVSWENQGPWDLWQFQPQVESQLAFDDSTEGTQISLQDRLTVFGQEYLTEVQCDDQNSSPGLCDSLEVSPNGFRSYRSALNGSIQQSLLGQRQNTILPVFEVGQKLVLKFRVKLFASCIGPEGRDYALTVKNGARAYSNSAQPNVGGEGAVQDRVAKVASFAAKPCSETMLNLSTREFVSDPAAAAGQARAKVDFIAENNRRVDPCGPGNAYWEVPASTAQVTWRKNQDGSIDAVAKPGYAFATSVSNQYQNAQHFDAPVDSNRACPTIQLKVKGDRLKGSAHQFTIAWNQTNPATPANSATVSSNIPSEQTVVDIETSAVTTVNKAEGMVSLTSSPAEALGAYQPTLECHYKEASSPEIAFAVTDKGVANNRKTWTLKIPDTDAFVTCEVTIVGGLSDVSVRSFDGGYPGTTPGAGTSTPTPMNGAQEWTIYPESTIPGTFDTARGKVAVLDQTNGKYVFSGLRPGIYYVGRTVTPQGFDPHRLQVDTLSGVSKVVAQGKDYIKLTVGAGNLVEVVTYATRQLGSLTFDKVSSNDTTTLLPGSAWTLRSADGGGVGNQSWTQDIPLEDCVAQTEASCTELDKQPEAGRFRVDGLKWGAYELRETQAPVGFRLPESNAVNGKNFTVAPAHRDHSFIGEAGITSDRSGVPSIPHTGGLGRDHLIISGLIVLLIAGVATVLLLRTAQQRP